MNNKKESDSFKYSKVLNSFQCSKIRLEKIDGAEVTGFKNSSVPERKATLLDGNKCSKLNFVSVSYLVLPGICSHTASDNISGIGRSSSIVKKKLMPHLPGANVRNGEILMSPYITYVLISRDFGANVNISYLSPINYCHGDLKGQRFGS